MGPLLALVACRQPDDPPDARRGPEPDAAVAPAPLRRLTRPQFEASLEDVFGPGLVLPPYLEPDVELEGFVSVGAGTAALSPYGVEQYESAAYLVAGQVLDDRERRAALPCDPVDDGCATEVAEQVGRRLWRRSLTAAEVDVVEGIADAAVDALGDPEGGVEFALAALLQSPNFVYRVELGDGDALDGVALASRMAFLAWGGPPDDELLDLAESGELVDPEVRRDQMRRMADDPRSARGVRALFFELLGLERLGTMTKDPTVYVHASPELAPAAREETLALVERLWADDADFRDLVTSPETRIDRTLAAIYSVPAPSRDGAADYVFLPSDDRLGLFGHASFLAMQSHPTSTSVTRRGMYVRERLLCQEMPAPPADVDTSIPEATAETPTMRDRVAIHLESPVCATCHQLSDPLGLALEHFDGIGRYRPDDQGYAIDASGDLDGRTFVGLAGLASAVHDHPEFARCLVGGTLRYAQGHHPSDGEEQWGDWLAEGFAEAGFAYGALLEDLVVAESFARNEEAQ